MLHLQIEVEGGALPFEWKAMHNRLVSGSAAGEVQKLTAAHLNARPSRQYWQEAAMHVETAVEGGATVVSVNHRGAALHFYGTAGLPGGELRATGRTSLVTGKPTKRLLIPTDDSPLRKGRVELYELGVAPEDMSVHRKGERAWLFADIGGEEVLLGSLVAAVRMEPDPTVLPPDSTLAAAAERGAQKALQILIP